ncbi:MAG: cytochrome b5 domain-containing protein [Candidatus Aenigmatarchaeota archaeon]
MNKKIILIGGVIFLILIVPGIFIYLNKQEVFSPNQIKTEKQEIIPLQDQSIQSQNQEKLTQTSGEEKTEENEKTYTMEEVAKHNSKESCWSVIRGKVYDLTNFIYKHPGGADKILKICGKDGTDLFVKMHGGKKTPEEILKSFEIGVLKSQ